MRWPLSPKDPDAPLVVRFAALGDVVFLAPLLEALCRRYGRPVDVLGSGPWTETLLGDDPAVGELRLVTSRRAPHWLLPSRWAADAWLRAHRGPVYLCDHDRFAQRLVARSGIAAERIVRAWDHWPGQDVHWADWWLDVARLDAPALPGLAQRAAVAAQPRLHVPTAWHADAAAWLHATGLEAAPLVLIQAGHKKTYKRGRVGTSGHDKHWPAERWAGVIRGIAAELPGAAVLVCGSPREAALAGAIVDAVGPLTQGARAVNAAALDLTLPRLAGVAGRAHSMVSVGTGPAHVAAALDCPLVVMFGRFGWARWKPRAPTATVTALGPREPDERARVMDLGVDEVLAAWRALPTRPGPSRATTSPLPSMAGLTMRR